MVEGLGGEDAVLRLLHSAAATIVAEGAALQQPFILRRGVGSSGIAIRAGPCFIDWGVVLQHRNSTAWFCTTCLSSVHSCPHVSALGNLEEGEAPEVTLSAGAFRRKLGKFLDLQTGDTRSYSASGLKLEA